VASLQEIWCQAVFRSYFIFCKSTEIFKFIEQTDAHTNALKKAAEKAIERENAQSKRPLNIVEEDASLTASNHGEKAYTALYQRIQDATGKAEAWKSNLLDQSENVSLLIIFNVEVDLTQVLI